FFFFFFLRNLRGAGRSSTSSSRSSSSGSSGGGAGAAFRSRAAAAFVAGVGPSPLAAGTAKPLAHFGHLIMVPTGSVSSTLRRTLHEGQASFLASIVDNLSRPVGSVAGAWVGFAGGRPSPAEFTRASQYPC